MPKSVKTLLLPQKGNCEDCAHYSDCPRMRGHNVCYSSMTYKEQLMSPPPQAGRDALEPNAARLYPLQTVEKRDHVACILVVDDDPTSRRMLQGILEREGFRVYAACDGREGRQKAAQEQPDLIIMDIQMPVEGGIEACKKIKKDPTTAGIPVIFISGIEDVESKIEGFNAGGVDYITKPYQAPEVLARVRLHIRLWQAYRSMVAASLEQLRHLSDSQKSILVQPEQYPDANFSVCFHPAQSAGGDFYDVFQSGTGIFDYLVADISGHHAGTALPAAALKALLHQNSSMLYSPAENLTLLNQHLRPVLQEGQYATLIYARLNRARMRLSMVNAGHPPAIHFSPGKGARVILQNSDGLGLFDMVALDEVEIPVAPGDRVFLYSDGIIEEDLRGPVPRRVGLENLLEAVNLHASQNIESAVQAIQKHLYIENRMPSDDIVLLGFEV